MRDFIDFNNIKRLVLSYFEKRNAPIFSKKSK